MRDVGPGGVKTYINSLVFGSTVDISRLSFESEIDSYCTPSKSKFIGHSSEIIWQSKIKLPLQNTKTCPTIPHRADKIMALANSTYFGGQEERGN